MVVVVVVKEVLSGSMQTVTGGGIQVYEFR